MYLAKTPTVIQSLFPSFIWRIPTNKKQLFLTFDDGPVPEATPWILDTLEKYQAHATFFCVGENVSRYPRIINRMLSMGHSIGSHTNNHISGWSSENIPYFHNVRRGATMVKSSLFRPPYGRIKPSQVQFLHRHYHIVMWDVLSGDFDASLSAENCLYNVVQNAQPGSIIVMHDSIKTINKLKFVLPELLQFFSDEGYSFQPLTEEIIEGKEEAMKQSA